MFVWFFIFFAYAARRCRHSWVSTRKLTTGNSKYFVLFPSKLIFLVTMKWPVNSKYSQKEIFGFMKEYKNGSIEGSTTINWIKARQDWINHNLGFAERSIIMSTEDIWIIKIFRCGRLSPVIASHFFSHSWSHRGTDLEPRGLSPPSPSKYILYWSPPGRYWLAVEEDFWAWDELSQGFLLSWFDPLTTGSAMKTLRSIWIC